VSIARTTFWMDYFNAVVETECVANASAKSPGEIKG